jgi:hypothetical protein
MCQSRTGGRRQTLYHWLTSNAVREKKLYKFRPLFVQLTERSKTIVDDDNDDFVQTSQDLSTVNVAET